MSHTPSGDGAPDAVLDVPDEPTPTGSTADAETPEGAPARRRRWPRLVLIISLVLVVLAAGGAFAGWRYLRSVEDDVARIDDPFAEVVEAERPVKPVEAAHAMNVLILGSDTRDPGLSGSRSDVIMVAHVTSDRSAAQVVSIPRDTWVSIPKAANGRGGGHNKINSAFATGGIPLMVRTVEAFTKLRIDHVIVIDFAGFAQIVDAVGGIDVKVEKSFTSIHTPFRRFRAGKQHFDGEEALDYARQRKQFNDGDFSRIEHQQQVVNAIIAKATTAGIITNPGKLDKFLRAVARSITADRKFDLLGTATDLRGIQRGSIRFLTNPSRGTGMEGNQSVVYNDPAPSTALFQAIAADTGATWKEP